MKLEVNETKYIYVDAKSWYASYPNVEVQKGEVYSFKVNPLFRWKTGRFSFNAKGMRLHTPFKKKRCAKAPFLSLCATIDRSEEVQFNIGLWLDKFEIQSTGELHFFANKFKDQYDMGSGHVVVEMDRIK